MIDQFEPMLEHMYQKNANHVIYKLCYPSRTIYWPQFEVDVIRATTDGSRLFRAIYLACKACLLQAQRHKIMWYSHRLCTCVFNSLRFVPLVHATFVIVGIAVLILNWALELGAIAIAPAHVDAAE
jgi:hypothetical protein